MAQPKSLAGLPAPLFEKLTDLHPTTQDDDQDLVFQTKRAVEESIRRELERLLDTRLPWRTAEEIEAAETADIEVDDEESAHEPIDREATVLRYGIPDITHLCVRNTLDRFEIERMLTRAVRTFEPRLIDADVTIQLVGLMDAAHLTVSGAIRLGRALEPMSFSLGIDVRVGGAVKRELLEAADRSSGRIPDIEDLID